jgi:O-antigen ligase
VLAAIAAIAWMVIVSQSRTGVLVFLFIVGISFLRRVGPWGVVVGCVMFPPMLMFGGRSGAEAEASAEERTELLAEGLQMIRQSKGIGVGVGQFGDESSIGLTAHNSYLLAAAETGIIGLCLFGLTLYLALKVPISIWLGDYRLDNTLTRLAPALAICIGGAYLGIFFLSWSYKDVLYMMLGASAALYQAARAQDPSVRVGITWREAALVCAGSLALMPLLYIFLRLHG